MEFKKRVDNLNFLTIEILQRDARKKELEIDDA